MVSSGIGNNDRSVFLRLVDFSPKETSRVRVNQGRGRRRAHRQAMRSIFQWRLLEKSVFVLASLVVMIYLGTSALLGMGPFAQAPLVTHTVTIRVAPGDTLWSLSRSLGPSTMAYEQRLDQIRQLNPGLDPSAPLQPGAAVVFPVSSAQSGQ